MFIRLISQMFVSSFILVAELLDICGVFFFYFLLLLSGFGDELDTPIKKQKNQFDSIHKSQAPCIG